MGRGRPSGRDELWERETPRGRTSPDEGVGGRGERWRGGSVEILSEEGDLGRDGGCEETATDK